MIFIFFIFYLSSLFGDYSIVFIHIGKEIPHYADIALSQARLFNPNGHLILLGSREGLKRFKELGEKDHIELCSYEDLQKNLAHQIYERECVEPSLFWRYTSERFLYLGDLMEKRELENVFHLEYDNMLYANLETLLPHFQANYPGIGATFDNDQRCIPGFVWISCAKAMGHLSQYFADLAPHKLSDMEVMGKYKNAFSHEFIDNLPIIMPSYVEVHPLESPSHHTTSNPSSYSNHIDVFKGIFDAAAIGQYLGGIDPIHNNNEPGFINESCLFNPSLLSYHWILDEQGREVPHVSFDGHLFPLINLHVHSKRLSEFRSL